MKHEACNPVAPDFSLGYVPLNKKRPGSCCLESPDNPLRSHAVRTAWLDIFRPDCDPWRILFVTPTGPCVRWTPAGSTARKRSKCISRIYVVRINGRIKVPVSPTIFTLNPVGGPVGNRIGNRNPQIITGHRHFVLQQLVKADACAARDPLRFDGNKGRIHPVRGRAGHRWHMDGSGVTAGDQGCFVDLNVYSVGSVCDLGWKSQK